MVVCGFVSVDSVSPCLAETSVNCSVKNKTRKGKIKGCAEGGEGEKRVEKYI